MQNTQVLNSTPFIARPIKLGLDKQHTIDNNYKVVEIAMWGDNTC